MKIELNANFVKTNTDITTVSGSIIMLTPPLGEDYWIARVPLSDKQAIVTFPKFGLWGIGFQYEKDWNTNLPSGQDAESIYKHIRYNKGDDSISDANCLVAIRLLQEFIKEHLE